MKKVFVLSKGLEKFSTKQIENMESLVGGVKDVPVVIYYPTSGGRHCPQGQFWSESLGRCIGRIQKEEVKHNFG